MVNKIEWLNARSDGTSISYFRFMGTVYQWINRSDYIEIWRPSGIPPKLFKQKNLNKHVYTPYRRTIENNTYKLVDPFAWIHSSYQSPTMYWRVI